MSYAIIRNAKYKSENLKGIYRHNERRNTNYSNKNIDKEKSYLNYSLKSPQFIYEKEFERIRKEYNLKGQIKTVSNIVCEYKDLGEQYILSAKVHMDEEIQAKKCICLLKIIKILQTLKKVMPFYKMLKWIYLKLLLLQVLKN